MIEHVTTGESCWCNPKTDDKIVKHKFTHLPPLHAKAMVEYWRNPLAKCFVDVLCQQLKINPSESIIVGALASLALLELLDKAQKSMQLEVALMAFRPDPIFKV